MKVVNIPVKVLTWGKTDGELIPLKLELTDENEELQEIKIERVIKKDKEKFAGKDLLKYTCQIKLRNVERLIELWCTKTATHENPALKWKLHKL